MTQGKAILRRAFGLILCVTFLFSCHTNNNVVSSYGKRKYMKGWFWNRHGKVEDKTAEGKDSGLTHKYPAYNKEEKTKSGSVANGKEQEQSSSAPKKHHHHRKKAEKTVVASNAAKVAPKNKTASSKANAPPEPPDNYMMRLLILIAILTGFSILITGLITPIVIWGITQNFLLAVGVVFTFIALFLSVDTSVGINVSDNGTNRPYNIGKPAWILSIVAAILVIFLYATVKTPLISNFFLVDIATIGLFVAGACVLLSLILAVKALFVNDRHKGKAVIALLIDALLITAVVLLF